MAVTGRPARAGVGRAAPLALFVGLALLYALNLDLPPHPDELYHLLAARGLNAEGVPSIAEGLYTRTLLYTRLIAASTAWLGDTLVAARLPSVLLMAAADALLFIWLRRVAGSRAAWLGALLFALSPFAVDIARFARFYAAQTLAFLVCCLAAAEAVRAGLEHGRRLGLGLLALAAGGLAVYLQVTTLIGLAGLAAWLAGALLLPWAGADPARRRRRLALLGALLALGLVLALAALASGLLEPVLRRYRFTPLFNRATADQPAYYFLWYNLFYPTLWTLLPVLALVALVARPRPASLALTVFATAFVLQSFAAAKSLRYVIYAQPFLFALWGIALAELWPRLLGWLDQLGAGLGRLAEGARARRVARAAVAGAALCVVLANPAWLRSTALLAGITVPPEEPPTGWAAAAPALAPWLEAGRTVVTTSEMETLYFLGRFDVTFSRSRQSELPGHRDFAPDPRTGLPVIGSAASMARLMACAPQGLVVSPLNRWGATAQLPPDAAELIAERARPLPLPPETRLVAYVWERAPAPPATDCRGVPGTG